ncbi:MAG: SurA N-terminal domain-containing protein [Desulfuromonadales bacterium]|nr:SurA N-terminal domain-containing protein [Desulfuromonadales bacterium]
MLDFIRQKQQTIIIKVVFGVIVLSFIGTMFLVWGKGSDGSKRSQGFAAKVNGDKISLEEFQGAYQRIRNIYQQIYGQSMPPDMEKMLNLKKVALDSLIDNHLILIEADRMGIKVSKDDVSNVIAGISMFQKNGAFSFDLYQQLLKSNRMTTDDFEEGQKKELIIKKARQAIKDKVVVSDEEALNLFRKENDKIDLEYVTFAPADVIKEIKPTEAELKEYLQKNQDDFKTAEKTAITYIMLDPASLASKLTLTEDEIQGFYQKNIDRWQGPDGILPLKDVRERVKAEALKQKSSRQAFELAADTLFKNIKSGDLSQIASQLHLKVQETPLFPSNAPPQTLTGETVLLKKAFELKQGELGGPVETARGIYILKATQRVPSAVRPLAEIRGDVEQRTKAAKSVELARKKAEEAAGMLVAKKTITTKNTGSFGYSAKGDVPVIGNSPDLMEAAFKLTTAAPAAPAPIKVGNRWYAIRLKTRLESPRTAFESTKAQLKQKMLPKKQEESLTAWIKDLRSKAKIETNPTLVADK